MSNLSQFQLLLISLIFGMFSSLNPALTEIYSFFHTYTFKTTKRFSEIFLRVLFFDLGLLVTFIFLGMFVIISSNLINLDFHSNIIIYAFMFLVGVYLVNCGFEFAELPFLPKAYIQQQISRFVALGFVGSFFLGFLLSLLRFFRIAPLLILILHQIFKSNNLESIFAILSFILGIIIPHVLLLGFSSQNYFKRLRWNRFLRVLTWTGSGFLVCGVSIFYVIKELQSKTIEASQLYFVLATFLIILLLSGFTLGFFKK
ncbi:MAG: hypothetical protein ACE5K0_05220 [Candidatus Methanofastidiosia archaeon]